VNCLDRPQVIPDWTTWITQQPRSSHRGERGALAPTRVLVRCALAPMTVFFLLSRRLVGFEGQEMIRQYLLGHRNRSRRYCRSAQSRSHTLSGLACDTRTLMPALGRSQKSSEQKTKSNYLNLGADHRQHISNLERYVRSRQLSISHSSSKALHPTYPPRAHIRLPLPGPRVRWRKPSVIFLRPPFEYH
jgi:hypothetical protein